MVEELVEKRTPIKKAKKKTTKHTPTAKELKESRKTIDFWKKSKKGPGGMKPKHLDLYGNWLEKKEKLKMKK